MVKSKKILEKSKKEFKGKTDSILRLAVDIGSQLKLMEQFLDLKDDLHHQIDKLIDQLLELPLYAAMITWSHNMESFDSNLPKWMKILYNFADVFDDGKYRKISYAKLSNHKSIIDKIRCRRDLSLELRENLVKTYIAFLEWLSEQTYHHTPTLTDPDLIKCQGRVIAFPLFIKLLDQLDEKGQLVAKLLYFGGSRTLEDVLELKLQDVDKTKFLIRYESQLVSYPQHVFEDIKAVTQNRSSGRIFIGRGNAPLNPATIFRNFKEAASKVGLGTTFSPKILTTST